MKVGVLGPAEPKNDKDTGESLVTVHSSNCWSVIYKTWKCQYRIKCQYLESKATETVDSVTAHKNDELSCLKCFLAPLGP